MPMQRYQPEQIVALLRQVEVGIANGKSTPQACNEAENTLQIAEAHCGHARHRSGHQVGRRD